MKLINQNKSYIFTDVSKLICLKELDSFFSLIKNRIVEKRSCARTIKWEWSKSTLKGSYASQYQNSMLLPSALWISLSLTLSLKSTWSAARLHRGLLTFRPKSWMQMNKNKWQKKLPFYWKKPTKGKVIARRSSKNSCSLREKPTKTWLLIKNQ